MGVISLQDWESVAVFAEVRRNELPLALTLRHQNSWHHLQAWLRNQDDNCLELGLLRSAASPFVRQNAKIGLSLRLGGKSYICSTVISGVDINPFAELGSISVAFPSDVRLIQRRVDNRIGVPSQKKTSVMFWPGGILQVPSEDSPDVPAWFGEFTILAWGASG